VAYLINFKFSSLSCTSLQLCSLHWNLTNYSGRDGSHSRLHKQSKRGATTLSIMTFNIMTLSINTTHYNKPLPLCWVSLFYLLLCWKTICWMSLCWLLLCWVSWRTPNNFRCLWNLHYFSSFGLCLCFVLLSTVIIKIHQQTAESPHIPKGSNQSAIVYSQTFHHKHGRCKTPLT